MQRVAGEAERAGEVVRKMRSFVRGDEGQVSAVDANFLVAEVLRLAAPEARKSGVELDRALEVVCLVLADSIQVQQVLLNLVRNAVEAIVTGGARYAPSARDARAAGVAFEIAVTDTGPGLAAPISTRCSSPSTPPRPTASASACAQPLDRRRHGGRLWADRGPAAAHVLHFTPPTAQ